MSFMSSLRAMLNNKPEERSDWIFPEDVDQLKKWTGNNNDTVVIYKHSYRCGTCMISKHRVERVLDKYSGTIPFLFIDVNKERKLSAFITEKTGIRHESPQLIILRNGETIYHESHGGINPEEIIEQLSS